jgi:GntR family transcriptional regulator/MocR family aminotransferase
MTRTSPAAFALLELDPSSTVPLYRQIVDAIAAEIASGRLAPGTRLPSTRAAAADLRVSRNTVLTAFEQLLAEGYVSGRAGSGTFVADAPPEACLAAEALSGVRPAGGTPDDTLSRRGSSLAGLAGGISHAVGRGYAFRFGTPALDRFPYDVWVRLHARHHRRPARELLGYGDPAGWRPLREAIADYLRSARRVECDPDRLVITAGTQQAVGLAARALLDPGDAVWVEEPCYPGARAALIGAGATIVPVPVDAQGIDVAAAVVLAPGARMAYVTPANQHPLGVALSPGRRSALLAWARAAGAWVIEDDYDSEYRYASRPFPSLQGEDVAGRVLYVGSLGKMLFPSLRLAYMVLPASVAGGMVASRLLEIPPTIEQMVLADFVAEGHFVRHIRRMRSLYAERQAALLRAAARGLSGLLRLEPADAGMFLRGELAAGIDDVAVSAAAAARGLDVQPLSPLYSGQPARAGLLLGYACVGEREMRTGIRSLAEAIRDVAS